MEVWLLLLLTLVTGVPYNSSTVLRKIAFGSCAGHFGLEHPAIWKSIVDSKPDLFVWLGDAVYADTMYFPLLHTYTPPEEWEGKFKRMKEQAGYKQLRTTTPILGVWDDHDYGINNGDKTNAYKTLAQKLYLDFLDEPETSPRRTQAGLQVAYRIGPKGKQVKLILLDVRWFRDPWGYEGDTLGKEQWDWLEKELRDPADITLIGSGMQILTQDKFGVTERFHPKSAERLEKLVAESPNTFLLSGDVHISEVMKSTCYGRPVYEITSSGLTHTAYTQYGFLGKLYSHLLQPSTFNTGKRIFEKSFCLISIDWKNSDTIVTFTFKGDAGQELFSEKVILSELKKTQKNELCLQSPWSRALRHWIAALYLFFVPVFLHFLAVVVFLRKWSHSF